MGKKSKGAMAVPMSTSGGEVSSRIESAENGFIVHLTRDTQGKHPSYHSRRFVATSRPKAVRIANQHMRGADAKVERGKKKSRSSGRA